MKTTILLVTITSAIFLALVSFQGMIHTQALTFTQNQAENNLKSTQPNSLNKPRILIAIRAFLIVTVHLCKGFPAVISKCQAALKLIQILGKEWPDIVCSTLVLFYFIFYGLADLLYFLGFLLLSQIASTLAELIDEFLFSPHCPWGPYTHQFTRSKIELLPCQCENSQ